MRAFLAAFAIALFLTTAPAFARSWSPGELDDLENAALAAPSEGLPAPSRALERLALARHKTRRAVIVDEGWKSGSLSAEIGMRIVEQSFFDLDAPIARVCSAEVPIPYAQHLEAAALPQTQTIVAAARTLLGKS